MYVGIKVFKVWYFSHESIFAFDKVTGIFLSPVFKE